MKMINNAVSIGSAFGIPIRLHISLLIAVPLFSIYYNLGLMLTLILAVGIFGSVALHELGHSVVAQAKGAYIHEIVLYPFGGAAKISNIPKQPADEILVALAGPAVSLVLALTLIFTRIELLIALGMLNGILFFFNVLPVFPMDGGRVLRASLSIKKDRMEATRIAATVGKYFCGLFVLIGLFGFNGQIFGIIGPIRPNFILAFIGFYIYRAGQIEYRMVRTEHQANHFSGHREGQIDVEVSPPPYAEGDSLASLKDKVRNLFRR